MAGMDADLARDTFDRGYAALEAGDFREAIECFTRAIGLKPTAAAVYLMYRRPLSRAEPASSSSTACSRHAP